MSKITHFHGILPPERPASNGRRLNLPPSQASPGGLILHALAPLRSELDTALARNDREKALNLAYSALSQVADSLAAMRGDRLLPWQVRIHALLVELETLPFALEPDGTLTEQGTAVHVSYRNWAVSRHKAAAVARRLSQQFQTLWPGSWVVLAEEATHHDPAGTPGNGQVHHAQR